MSWKPRLTPDGTHLVSGAGALFDHDSPLLDTAGQQIVGWEPVPFIDSRWIVYNAQDRGVWAYDLWTRAQEMVWPTELRELAGGGGVWAGRDDSRNVLVVFTPGVGAREIPHAGQPSINEHGDLLYRTGDDMVEPWISLTAAAWGDGRGRLFGAHGSVKLDITVGPEEARPVVLDTPEGPWVFCMAGTGVHLRPLFSAEGYEPPAELVGNNRNLHPHAVCLGSRIFCVWNDDHGNTIPWRVDLSEPRKPLATLPPVVVTPPPVVIPQEPPTMSVPDYSAELAAFLTPRLRRIPGDEQGTREISFTALNAWVTEKRKTDTRVGLLEKTGGAKVLDRAADIVAYDLGNGTCQLMDAISNSEGAPNPDRPDDDPTPKPDWRKVDAHEAGIRPISQWKEPYPVSGDDGDDEADVNDGQGNPPVVIPPVCTDCTELRLIVKQLNTDLAMLRGVLEGMAGDLEDAEHSLIRRIVALENRPAFDVTKYRAKSSGGWLGHGHDLEEKK